MNRKELIRQYKETPRPAGIYRVQHVASGRCLFGSSPDAPAMLNRIRAQLRTRGHPSRALQADWDRDGPDAFRFEVVDLLPPGDSTGADHAEDLETLEALWREKLGLGPGSSY
jgi:hypothetical protein